MARLDIERQERLEPQRIRSTAEKLRELGFTVDFGGLTEYDIYGYTVVGKGLKFDFYPYSGWWSGRGIGSGRGFKKLLKKLKEVE